MYSKAPTLSLSDLTNRIKPFTSVSVNTGVNNKMWCFLQKCGERQTVNPCGTNPPPPPHLVPQCLLTVERGNMDEGTAGRGMDRDVQRERRRRRRGCWKLVNWDCFWLVFDVLQPVERMQAGMKWDTDTRRGRLRIKRRAQEQKQRHLIWNRISEVAD